MWAKWLGIVLLFIVCNGWGIWLAARYQTRVNILTGIREMFADMRSGMGSMLCTPDEWVRRYRPRSPHPFIGELLDTLLEHTGQHPSVRYSDSWDKAVTDCQSHNIYSSALTRDDIAVLRRVGGGLGASDTEALLKNLSYADELMDKQRSEAAEECKRKKGMFLRMGFLMGLAAVIILV